MAETATNATTLRIGRWLRRARKAYLRGDLASAGRACQELLRLDPDHAEAYFIAASSALEGGYPRDALMGFARAAELEPERADFVAHLARCHAILGDHAAAQACVARAEKLPISEAQIHDTLGHVLTVVSRHRDAARHFARATEMAPGNAQFHYHLGLSLTYCGDFVRATSELERVLELDPDHGHAWIALADLLEGPPPADRIARLEAALERAGGKSLPTLYLSQALARTLESAGETGKAFAVWQDSKARHRRAVGYTIDADRAVFAALDDVFRDSPRRDERPGDPDTAPIFVVGMPRTGTTLVDRILASHPDVVSAGELSRFPQAVRQAGGSLSADLIDPATFAAAADSDPAAIGAGYLRYARQLVGDASRFVDKLPLNFLMIGFIRRALPEAKIVCLRRSALDTCLANFRQLFAPAATHYHYALSLADTAEYYALFDRLMAFWLEQHSDHLVQVQYETLVEDTETEARRLLDFLDLEFVPAVLDFDTHAAPTATASAVQVRRPIYRDSVGAWRRYQRELEPLERQLEGLGVAIA